MRGDCILFYTISTLLFKKYIMFNRENMAMCHTVLEKHLYMILNEFVELKVDQRQKNKRDM